MRNIQGRFRSLGATVLVAIAVPTGPAHASCQSFDCHFVGHATAVGNARETLERTEGSTSSADRLARLHALRTLASQGRSVALLLHDRRWMDTTGLEATLAADATRFTREADDLMARWQAEQPDDPRPWLAQADEETSIDQRRDLLDEARKRLPKNLTKDDFPLVQGLTSRLRRDHRLDDLWQLVDRYIAQNPDDDHAYSQFSNSAWHHDDQARLEEFVWRWLERRPDSLAALTRATKEMETSPRFRTVVEAIPDQITRIEASHSAKGHLCNRLRWVDDSAHFACHLNLAAEAAPADYPDVTYPFFEAFIDTALELDRWDAIESLIATLPPTPSDAARFQAAERAVIHDSDCRRGLTLFDGVDFVATRPDQAADWLIGTLSRCGRRDRPEAVIASTRHMAELTLAGLTDPQLRATHLYAHEDLLMEELERRLAVDPTNTALHATLDSRLEWHLRDTKQCQCGRVASLTTWANALPDDDTPWRRLAEAYQASGKAGPATRALEQAWRRAPGDRALAGDLVDAALASRHFDLAETAGTFLLETAVDPKNTAEAHLALFRTAVDRGNGRTDRKAALDHGRAYFPLAIRYQRLPADGVEHAFLALLDRENNHTEIENYVRAKAAYLDPQNADSPITRRDAVWPTYDREGDPQRHDIRRMLGDVWVSLGRHDLALPYYEAAADRLSPHPETLVRLARARGAAGSGTTATQAFRDAIAIDPQRVLDQARYLAERGDVLTLEQLEAELVSDDLTLADRVSVLSARALATRGGERVALSRLAALVARSTNAFDAHFELARLHEHAGDIDSALRHYRRYQHAARRGPRSWPETTAYRERRCWIRQHVDQLIASANAPATPSRPDH